MLKTKLKKISDSCFSFNDDHVNYYYFNETCASLHRIDGPAIEFKNGESHWYQFNERHRMDGPAIISGAFKQWWLNGKQFETEEEWQKALTTKSKRK